jgi:hypothetical protein
MPGSLCITSLEIVHPAALTGPRCEYQRKNKLLPASFTMLGHNFPAKANKGFSDLIRLRFEYENIPEWTA